MSYDPNHLTTDAVPRAPRKLIPNKLHKPSVSTQKNKCQQDARTENGDSNRVQADISGGNRRRTEDSKAKKERSKSVNNSKLTRTYKMQYVDEMNESWPWQVL